MPNFKLLCLISMSSNGIPENEVMVLMKSVGIELNRLEWAQMLRSLKIFFRFDRFNNTQLIALKNRFLSSVCEFFWFIFKGLN